MIQSFCNRNLFDNPGDQGFVNILKIITAQFKATHTSQTYTAQQSSVPPRGQSRTHPVTILSSAFSWSDRYYPLTRTKPCPPWPS